MFFRTLGPLLMAFPPYGNQTHPNSKNHKWRHLGKSGEIDPLSLEPKKQDERRWNRAGGCLAREREHIKKQRQPVKPPASPLLFPDEPRPGDEREKEEESHQNILSFRNPCDRFYLHWMQGKEGAGQPRARDSQISQENPHENGIGRVQDNIHPMITRRV